MVDHSCYTPLADTANLVFIANSTALFWNIFNWNKVDFLAQLFLVRGRCTPVPSDDAKPDRGSLLYPKVQKSLVFSHTLRVHYTSVLQ